MGPVITKEAKDRIIGYINQGDQTGQMLLLMVAICRFRAMRTVFLWAAHCLTMSRRICRSIVMKFWPGPISFAAKIL